MWSYLQSWFLEIRGPISRAGSLKYVVLNPELVPVLVPCNTWSYLQSFFLGIHSNISRAAAGTKAGSLKYLVLSPKLVPAFSMVPSLEMVPWNTWSYLQSWYLPFPCFHLWRWFLEICGPISATIHGAGTSLFRVSISGDGPAWSCLKSGYLPFPQFYICHHFWIWYQPFPWYHLWWWFLEIPGPIYRAGTYLFHGSISGDGPLKYVVLSLLPFMELAHPFSVVPSLEMVAWNAWSCLQSWYQSCFLEIRGPIYRAGSLKYVVLL